MHRCLESLAQIMSAKHADPTLLQGVLPLVDALVRKASSTDRRLAPAGSVPLPVIADAITDATGITPGGVLVLSASAPFPRPEWMTDESYMDAFRSSIGTDLGEAFGRTALPRFWKRCEAEGRTGAWMEIHNVYWPGVRSRFAGWAHGGFPPGLGSRVETCLDQTTRLALGFAFLGDEGGLRSVTPLMRLLTLTLPVARKKGDDRVWLTLAA